METFLDVLKVIFVIAAGVGGLFLLVTVISGAVALIDSVRGRALRRVPVRTVADLLDATVLPRRAVVRAEPVGDLVSSPLSGASCLWFRLAVRGIEEVATDSGHDLRYTTVWSETSGQVVWYDDGTGAIPVEVSLLDKPVLDGRTAIVERSVVDEPGPSCSPGLRSVVDRATRDTKAFDLVEELVRPGAAATLFAHPVRRDGRVVLAGGHGTGASPKTYAELVDHHSRETREMWWGVRFALIIGVAAYLCGMGGLQLIRWMVG